MRKREVGGVMRALDYDFMCNLDSNGDLVFVQGEAACTLTVTTHTERDG